MKKFKIVLSISLLFSAFVCFGCRFSSKKTIKVGAMYALSGDKAAIGKNILRGIEFAADMINQQGGVNGAKIEIICGDTQGDARIARTVAEKLIIEDGVAAMLGCHQSTITAVAAQACEDKKIPMITAISTVDSLSTMGLNYFFRMCPMNTDYVENQFMYLKDLSQQKNISIKRVVVFADNSNIGQELIRCCRAIAPGYGIEIAAEIQYSGGTASFKKEVEKIRSLNPDAVLCESYIADAIFFTKTLNENNVKPPVIIAKANGFADPSFIPATGSCSNGIASVVEYNADLMGGAEINEKFRERYGIDMNGHSAESFTAMWVLKTAIENAKSTDGTKIKEALESLHIVNQFPGKDAPKIILPYNEIKFESETVNGIKHTHNNTAATVAVSQIQDGKWVSVWPFDVAPGKVLYPAPLR